MSVHFNKNDNRNEHKCIHMTDDIRKWEPIREAILAREHLANAVASMDRLIDWQSELSGLPIRVVKSLHDAGVYTRKDLTDAMRGGDLRKKRNIGESTLTEIDEWLARSDSQ